MNNRRNLLVNKSDNKFVDLGLPSGLKWAHGNIVKNGSKYEIGDETDYGAYISWGNITPHFSINGSFDDGYSWGTSNNSPYASTPGHSLSGNIASNDTAHDAALALLGSPWHLPTKENFLELYDNTDNEWTTINGMNGRKFMNKNNHSIYVFFPAAGNGYGTSHNNRGSRGHYWSSSWNSANSAYYMFFNNSSVVPQATNSKFYGLSVRAVLNSRRTVTITIIGSTIAGVNLTLTDSEGTQHTATTDVSGTVEFTLVAYGNAILSADGQEFSPKFSPNPITVSASESFFTVEMSPLFIDLGLPSGLKWATGNLKKSGNTCVIGNETDYGDFWSWANVGLTNATGWMDAAGGKMTQTMYDSTTGSSQSVNISATDASHDVAYKYLGTPWRLPTRDEFTELYNNTDYELMSINGIYGCKFMKKTNHSIYVFFPMSGNCSDKGLGGRTFGNYWSSTYHNSSTAYYLDFYDSYMSTSGYARYRGRSVRPVQ